jgi:hypothetical protein
MYVQSTFSCIHVSFEARRRCTTWLHCANGADHARDRQSDNSSVAQLILSYMKDKGHGEYSSVNPIMPSPLKVSASTRLSAYLP